MLFGFSDWATAVQWATWLGHCCTVGRVYCVMMPHSTCVASCTVFDGDRSCKAYGCTYNSGVLYSELPLWRPNRRTLCSWCTISVCLSDPLITANIVHQEQRVLHEPIIGGHCCLQSSAPDASRWPDCDWLYAFVWVHTVSRALGPLQP